MFLLNQRVTWWSVQSPCGEWKEIPWSSLCLKRTERLGVCVCESERARKAFALHGQSHLTAHLSQTPPLLSYSKEGADDGVTRLSAVYRSIIFRCSCYYLQSQSLPRWPQQTIKHKSFTVWVRSLHHNSHLPLPCFPTPLTSHSHVSINTQLCSRQKIQAARLWYHLFSQDRPSSFTYYVTLQEVIHSNTSFKWSLHCYATLMFRFLQCDPGAVIISWTLSEHTLRDVWSDWIFPGHFPFPFPKPLRHFTWS